MDDGARKSQSTDAPVVSPVDAKQGRRGTTAFVILVISLVLTAIAFVALFGLVRP